MRKETILRSIQKRLPDDIIIVDETEFDFNDDEYISILSWIKYFCGHYKEFGKNKSTVIEFPIISKRLRMDFGLYQFPDEFGSYVIYLTSIGRLISGEIQKKTTLKEIIFNWSL